jgi:hypothetical protein
MDVSRRKFIGTTGLGLGVIAAEVGRAPLAWAAPAAHAAGAVPAAPAAGGDASLTRATFEPLVGTTFRARIAAGRSTAIRLVEVADLPLPRAQAQPVPGEAFSLIFAGPSVFGQGEYPLAHPALGTVSVFLVPVGMRLHGPRYQAIFNHRGA